MAACGSLRALFENPLPENPTLIESLTSWNQIKSLKPIETGAFAEIFGELYFQEKPDTSLPFPPPSVPPALEESPRSSISEHDSKNREKLTLDALLGLSANRYDGKNHRGFSSKSSESLLMCTEGLGSESSDDVDDLMENGDDWRSWSRGKVDMGRRRRLLMANGVNGYTRSTWDARPAKGAKVFPPPISSIGKSGKPWVCLRSYREDGRFVLKEMRLPCQEYLHASREDGRLKLHFVHPDEDIAEGDEEEEEKEEHDEELEEEEEEV